MIRPFRAYRPAEGLAAKIAALPYDVMNADEARQMAAGNPLCFLRVDKAEIDLPAEADHYAPAVYAKAAENLSRLISDGALVQDAEGCLYLYRLTMGGRAQTGVVSCVSVDDYLSGRIKKHELTRADKELDRVNHVKACGAHTGPIYLAYRKREDIDAFVSDWTANHEAVYDFTAENGVRHEAWVLSGEAASGLQSLFSPVPSLYIADGHHRAAAAAKTALDLRAEGGRGGEFDRFLAVSFPDDQLRIMDYNRVVKTLNGLSEAGFLEAVAKRFDVSKQGGAYTPQAPGEFGMFLGGAWYRLAFPSEGALDVSVLQENLLAPILGIGDPRTDGNIDFVGGIRGLAELERRVGEGWAVAFAMYPTQMSQLFAVADAGGVMPPKSTWFEPKLLSGLFVHTFREG